jgi:hypothetical protein
MQSERVLLCGLNSGGILKDAVGGGILAASNLVKLTMFQSASD